MKKYASALALAAALTAPVAAHAEATFGGDMDLRFFTVSPNTQASNQDSTQGIDQRIRLKAAFKNEDGVQVVTRLRLSDNNWEGDQHATNGRAGVYSTHASDIVALDVGYVSLPVLGGNLNIGRMEANWGTNGFLTSDDRRDRILYLAKVGSVTLGAGMDKRVEGIINQNEDDGDMYQALAIGVTGGWLWGVAGAYFYGNDNDAPVDAAQYALRGAKLLSPFVKGKIGGFELQGTYNFVGGSDNEVAGAPGFIFSENSHAAVILAGYDFGMVKVEGQTLFVKDGGLVAGGWDSFSSFINNSPANNLSRLSQGNLAVGSGLGLEGTDRLGFMARVIVKPMKTLNFVASAGRVNYEQAAVAALGRVAAVDESVTFFEVQANYQLFPSTALNLTVARAQSKDYVNALSAAVGGAGTGAHDDTGVQLGIKTTF